MFKVLIVDDDSISRTNLKTLIEWERYGYEICGEAVNGLNAISLIENNPPDIVISDMNMPVMDGVALIKYIEQNLIGIQTIALSGYDDFNYVKESLKNGAVDYLLKHKLKSENLLNALNITREHILRNKQDNDQKLKLDEQLSASKPLLRQNFINQLVMGGISEVNEIQQCINELGMELDMKNLAIVVLEIDNFHTILDKFSLKEINKLISSIIDISSEILNDMGKAIISNIEGGKFVILFSFGNMRSDLYMYNHIVNKIDRIKTSIKRYLNITACFCLGKGFFEITEVSKQYKETERVLKDKFFKGKDQIIRDLSENNKKNEFVNLDISDEKNIINFIKSLNYQNLDNCINTIFFKIVEKNSSQKSVQMICAELINIINRVAREYSIDIKFLYSDAEIPYDEMKKLETLKEVKQWIMNIYKKLIDMLEIQNISKTYSEPIKRAMEYINKNYYQNISLIDVAGVLNVNSSYLSRIFKEACGKGFIEYLNMTRVEHAKRLIENGDYKLKTIVKEVGFNNYTYFFKVFKDVLGMTPQEFEEECRLNNNQNS